MTKARIAAVVLAAGTSSRMGANKLLAPIEGKPMIRHVVENALAAGLDPVCVVLGHQADQVAGALAGCAFSFTFNGDFAEGLSTSLKTGLAALPLEIDGAMVFLGDMPDIPPKLIARMAEAFDPANGRAIVAPVRKGRQGNPVLWGRAFFPLILDQCHGDSGAKALIARHGAQLVEIEADDDGVMSDLDTPQALSERRLNAPGAAFKPPGGCG